LLDNAVEWIRPYENSAKFRRCEFVRTGCTSQLATLDMRVTAIETIHVEAFPNITFVEVS